MNKFCTSCGGALLPNAKFCDACGTPIVATTGAEPSGLPPPPAEAAAFAALSRAAPVYHHPGPPRDTMLSRFFGFEHLIGRSLIKFIYFLGLAGIALIALFMLVASNTLGAMLGGNYSGLVLVFILVWAPFAAIFWRFTCECLILLFLLYDRLGEVRDRLPPAAK